MIEIKTKSAIFFLDKKCYYEANDLEFNTGLVYHVVIMNKEPLFIPIFVYLFLGFKICATMH